MPGHGEDHRSPFQGLPPAELNSRCTSSAHEDTLHIGSTPDVRSVLLKKCDGRIDEELAQSDHRDGRRRAIPLSEERGLQCVKERHRCGALRQLVHHCDGQGLPEAATGLRRLPAGGEPLPHRPAGESRCGSAQRGTRTEQAEAIGRAEEAEAEQGGDQVERSRKAGQGEPVNAPVGMVKRQCGALLNVDERERAGGLKEGQGTPVPCKEEVLAVVEALTRDAVTE
jgi:hypothetical protein